MVDKYTVIKILKENDVKLCFMLNHEFPNESWVVGYAINHDNFLPKILYDIFEEEIKEITKNDWHLIS